MHMARQSALLKIAHGQKTEFENSDNSTPLQEQAERRLKSDSPLLAVIVQRPRLMQERGLPEGAVPH